MSEIQDLSPSDWAVLQRLLELAADEFGSHGCNDYSLDDTPEHRDLLRRAEQECGDSEEELLVHNGKLLTQDWFLMTYFKRYAGHKAGLEVA